MKAKAADVMIGLVEQVGVDEGHVGIDKSRCKRNQPTLDSDDMKAKAADVMIGLVESFKSVVVLRDFVDQCQRILPEMIERCKQLQQQQQHKRIRMNYSQQNMPPEEEELYAESGDFSLNEEVDQNRSEENQHPLDEGANAKEESDASTQEESLMEMPSDEQAKIERIGNVLSSISTNSGKTDDLVHRLLKAYGLDDDSITEIINRMPDGDLHELKTYIRASPSYNSAKLAGSVLSQHLSHQMSATHYKELHSIDLTQSAPHIALPRH